MRLKRKHIFKTFLLSFTLGITNPAYAKDIQISATPIENFLLSKPDQIHFGKLKFLGGLVLTSDHEEFGGLSAMRFTNKNELVLVTDKARVITTTLMRNGDKPESLQNTEITRIKAANGRTITGAIDKDAEALEVSGNSLFIGYERNDRIIRFSKKNRTLIADNNYIVDLNPLNFPENKGPEAIAMEPSTKKLFVFAEKALNDDGNHQGYVISSGKIEQNLSVKYRDDFSLTDAAFLPDGDLILLERYYNPFTGVFLRRRRIKAEDLISAIPLDGEILIDVNYSHEIDNMEGLPITTMQDGSTRLTLFSDDNFSRNQRTILLEFKLVN